MISKILRTIIALPFLVVTWLPMQVLQVGILLIIVAGYVLEGAIDEDYPILAKELLLFPYLVIKKIWSKS